MSVTTKAKVLTRLEIVRANVQHEISMNAAEGFYAAGLSTEGYAGGYLQAINDVEAALRHGQVPHGRGYWEKQK
jgi:hypothetical protein